MKVLQIIMLLALSALFIQCSKDNNLVTMEYQETYCADKWAVNDNEEDVVLKAAQDYFNEKYSISFENIEFKSPGNFPEWCNACLCKSGRIISVSVDEAFQDEMESEGFVLK